MYMGDLLFSGEKGGGVDRGVDKRGGWGEVLGGEEGGGKMFLGWVKLNNLRLLKTVRIMKPYMCEYSSKFFILFHESRWVWNMILLL